ncbi:MAG: non-heme iron oxygenase ferredoxin subunit [Candidatus Omnitrophica bacterium]|nr:non-heme iron oxygenase ferredoxin subunit [Candidatus Omnitrophota bacterium]
MGSWIKAATVGELPPGQAKLVEAEGRQIALFNVGGTLYAIDNACSHAGGSLAEGFVEGGQVECSWHGARFDLKTGQALSAPASGTMATYKVRVSGSDVEIEV